MNLIDRIAEANRFDPAGLVPFVVAGEAVGAADTAFAERLTGWPDVFRLEGGRLLLNPDLGSPDARTAAVAPVLSALRDDGIVTGWRDELYPVFTAPDAPPLLLIERAAATLFGTRHVAVNLNGYVVETGGAVSVWLQRRSETKPINPGKLDVMVSGGLPAFGDPFENMVRECDEEAAIPASLARQARVAGTLDFRTRRADGVHHGHYLNYDLSLGADFRPENRDGEVDEFLLWPSPRIIEVLCETDDVAFDAALVIIDFLARHSLVPADDPVHGAYSGVPAQGLDDTTRA